VAESAGPGRFRALRSQAQTLRTASDAAIILVLGIGAVHQLQFMRGYADALEDLLAAPDFVQAFMERYADYWTCMTERALETVGDLVDLTMFGDDLGTQQGPVMSPAVYRRLIKPTHARMVQAVKRFQKPVLLHSCGSVAAFIPDLIEIGFDALHPIQVSARDMDSVRLKRDFGRDITFWGAIDTHRVLPRGTVAEVRKRCGGASRTWLQAAATSWRGPQYPGRSAGGQRAGDGGGGEGIWELLVRIIHAGVANTPEWTTNAQCPMPTEQTPSDTVMPSRSAGASAIGHLAIGCGHPRRIRELCSRVMRVSHQHSVFRRRRLSADR